VAGGVGGWTVSEAKERLTYAEAMQWHTYLERRGTLNLGLRIEEGFALLAMMINRALGGRANMSAFMPHFGPMQAPASSEPISADEALQLLTQLAGRTNASKGVK
jgi:hypothetical protein